MNKGGMIITVKAGCYAIRTPRKDPEFLELLKRHIPTGKRSWDPESFVWLVDPSCLSTLRTIIMQAGYIEPKIPAINAGVVATVQKTFTVEYLGQCKEREGGAITALGMVNGYWSIEIPEDVLKTFFVKSGGSALITDDQTFYQILCIIERASDQEIKSAYRRLARQWHPDVCAEPEAPAMFRRINEAYELLKDPRARRKYDAGLYFEREAAKKITNPAPKPGRRRFFDNDHYRAPLRCGAVTVEGVQRLNKFTVSRILAWVDATDEAGRVMSSSWSTASKSVVIKWL